MNLWTTALKIAAREARASALKFLFVAFGVAAGVGALTGVRGFSQAFEDTLRREARTLMAADISIRQFNPPTPEQEAAIGRYIAQGAVVTRITETVSMMDKEGSTAPPLLVSVKAVDPQAYPFYGKFELDPPARLNDALTAETIAISDDLAVRMDLAHGSIVRLGGQPFRVAGVVKSEPDRMTGSLNIGPRVLISRDGLDRTGLMQFGSRASYRLLFKSPEPRFNLNVMKADLNKIFTSARVATAREAHPAIERALERSTRFLSLVSLIALIVGALGVATSVHAHLQQRLDTIAIMKCLGARSTQIIGIYTIQTGLLAMAGGVAGVAVGAGVQMLFPVLLERYLKFEAGVGWSPAFALEGIVTGLLVTLLFTLPPLLSIRRVKPALIFRREMAEVRPPLVVRFRRQIPSILCGALILLGLGAIAGWLAESARMGWMFIGGLVTSLLVLSGVAWALLRGLRYFVRTSASRLSVPLRQGIANIYRPGNHAGAVLVSLGIGVMFTLSIYLIQKSLLAEVAGAAPPDAPNVFMINITEREQAGMRALLDAQPRVSNSPKARPRLVPLVPAKLLTINGQPLKLEGLRGWDRRFTQARQTGAIEEKPEELQIRQGRWWTANSTEAQVGLDEEAANVLKAKAGDILRYSVTGREFDARLAAVYRNISAGPTNVGDMVFNPAAVASFSKQYVGYARLPVSQVQKFQREAYAKFPTVTVVNAADVLAIVQEVVDQVSLLVRFIAAFAIAAGVIILMATVAGTRFRRMREAAVLKTLGARRRQLLGIFSAEFLIVGLVAGLMGGLLATAFSRLLMTRLLDAEFRVEWTPNLVTVALTGLLSLLAGWLASARVLPQKPLQVLRDE